MTTNGSRLDDRITTSLDQFLALRGALEDDREFDSAIEFLNQTWQEWTAA